jgi:hypothetical protein
VGRKTVPQSGLVTKKPACTRKDQRFLVTIVEAYLKCNADERSALVCLAPSFSSRCPTQTNQLLQLASVAARKSNIELSLELEISPLLRAEKQVVVFVSSRPLS